MYRVLAEELQFDFVIRFRGNIKVTVATGEARAAAEWVGAGGRMRVLRDATVTSASYSVGTVVCLQAKDMKEPWCLAASTAEEPARALVKLYAKRWGNRGRVPRHQRPALRPEDGRDARQHPRSARQAKRSAYDRHLKSNTTRRRTHSLFRRGSMLYELIPTMPDHSLRPLIQELAHMLAAQPVFNEMFGAN